MVIIGALRVLAEDREVPSVGEMEVLIEMSWDLHRHQERVGRESGLMDPRYYLIIACAGWPSQIRGKFLSHCFDTGEELVRRVIKSSLKNKYSY